MINEIGIIKVPFDFCIRSYYKLFRHHDMQKEAPMEFLFVYNDL